MLEWGVIYYFYFLGDVFYYFIIQSGVGIRFWWEWDNICVYLPFWPVSLDVYVPVAWLNVMWAMSMSIVASLAPGLFLTAWSGFLARHTLDRWLGFPQLLHVCSHAGHFSWRDQISEVPYWWLPQPTQSRQLHLASLLSWLR